MKDTNISETIRYIGADDKTLDLFEGQYDVPNGMSYNSYVIIDEKIAVMDAVDARASDCWEENLKETLGGREPDYLIISHVEPDHSGAVKRFTELYPKAVLVGNAKTFSMLSNFYEIKSEALTVKEGDSLSLGAHRLNFIMAPMVHWPEVMVTYEETEKILFSADAFGKFGTLDTDEDWTCEARRYYFNIVGKYGAPVQALLKKASALEVQTICPLHGPILKENIGFYVDKYNTWSSYKPEDKGVFIAYASIHGNTAEAAKTLADILREKGEEKVALSDLSRDDMAEAVEDAFRYDRIVLAASSYDGGVFLPMEEFLVHLRSKAYQNRKAAVVENGSWAPSAAKTIRSYLEGMKNIEMIGDTVTVRSALNADSKAQLEKLAEAIVSAV